MYQYFFNHTPYVSCTSRKIQSVLLYLRLSAQQSTNGRKKGKKVQSGRAQEEAAAAQVRAAAGRGGGRPRCVRRSALPAGHEPHGRAPRDERPRLLRLPVRRPPRLPCFQAQRDVSSELGAPRDVGCRAASTT